MATRPAPKPNRSTHVPGGAAQKLSAGDVLAVVRAHGLEAALTRHVRAEDIADERLARHWADAEVLLSLLDAIVRTAD